MFKNINVIILIQNIIINKCTPHCFMCQTPINDTNCRVMMMPRIMGIKSPMRLIEGINNMGKANKISIMAITVITVIVLGRCTSAILICSDCFYRI